MALARPMRGIGRWLVFLFALFCVLGMDAQASVASGQAWLTQQIQSDGSLSNAHSTIALPAQAQSEIAFTCAALNASFPASLVASLAGSSARAVEFEARKTLVQTMSAQGRADTDTLRAQQNADGGFGARRGYASNPLDTAWAVAAMYSAATYAHLAESTDQFAARERALMRLLASQKRSGEWQVVADGDALIPTAQIVQLLHPLRAQPTVSAALSRARQWMLQQRNGSQGWGDSHANAQALLALLPALDSVDEVRTAVTQLATAQQADGSWGKDVYVTALSVRALHLASLPSPNSDAVFVQGVVVAADTGLPLTGVVAQLMQAQRQAHSDAQGQFAFTALHAGADRLTLQMPGYRTLVSDLQLAKGQQVDLGTLRLQPALPGEESTVTLSGTVFSSTSSGNSQLLKPLVGSVVTVGTQSMATDAQGRYALAGLPGGVLTAVVTPPSNSGLAPQTVVLTVSAGQQVEFSPVLRAFTLTGAGAAVHVSDAVTGAPLSGASVQLNKASNRSTSSNGVAQFLATHNAVVTGTNFLTAVYSGYEQALVQFEGYVGQEAQLHVALRRVSGMSGSKVQLEGVVTDSASAEPLDGVTVRLVQPEPLLAQTDSTGKYVMSVAGGLGLDGANRLLEVSRAGYQSRTVVLSRVTLGRVNTFNLSMQPQPQPFQDARAQLLLRDGATGAAVVAASVSLTGANVLTTQSDAAGKVLVGALVPGSTQFELQATGYETRWLSAELKPGVVFDATVDLKPQTATQPKLFGVVSHADTGRPLAGASVVFAGDATGSGTVQAAANGYFEWVPQAAGPVELTVSASGFSTVRTQVMLDRAVEANPRLKPVWQQPVAASTKWALHGSVVDLLRSEPLAGAELVLEETYPDGNVVTRSATFSAANGVFQFEGIGSFRARLLVSMPGFDTQYVNYTRDADEQYAGHIFLKRSFHAALPDLMVGSGDRSQLVVDPATFMANGTITAQVTNNSQFATGAFDVVAFEDRDGDMQWNPQTDLLLGRQRVAALGSMESQSLTWTLKDTAMQFRDAPIFVMADSAHEVVESIEGNNVQALAVGCRGASDARLTDVGVCLDVSGSVSALTKLEIQGVIKALENPNIIPHDGSVRFALGTDRELAGSGKVPAHPAQIITPVTSATLIDALRKFNPANGGSAVGTCLRNMSNYLAQRSPVSGVRALIGVGDGQWEAEERQNGFLSEMLSNRVNRIDLIGVGNVNLKLLNALAYPKPANSVHGGKITLAMSDAEIAAAMAQAIGNAVRRVDLSLGGLALTDQGTGRPVLLSARVGNAGVVASQATTVRFYQAAVLLGEVAVPAMRAGEWADVQLGQVVLSGATPIDAVLDEADINTECHRGNNRMQIPAAAVNALAALSVETDLPSYGRNDPVLLGAHVRNAGAFQADLQLVLSVLDADDNPVITFPAQPLDEVPAGTQRSVSQPWHTAGLLAGDYVLQGVVRDMQGRELARHRALFSVRAGGLVAGPLATLDVSTDRRTYAANALVRIDNLVRNLAVNAPLQNAAIVVTVTDPAGKTVFTFGHAEQQIAAAGLRAESTHQPLVAAQPGTYTVHAQLSGMQKSVLAQATTWYEVEPSTVGALNDGLTGSVSVAHSRVMRGDAQIRNDVVVNAGATALHGVTVSRVLLDAHDVEVMREEQVVNLAPDERMEWAQTAVNTAGLAHGTYWAVLTVQSASGLDVLGAQSFEVGRPDAPPGQQVAHPVPTLGYGAMFVLAGLLMVMAITTSRRRQRHDRH